MKSKIIKTLVLITTNTSLVLLFWYFLDLSAFIISSTLLTLLNSVLLNKKNTSSSILSSFLQKQYYKTKFRILNNSDNKKGLKKFLINKTNTTYQKIIFNLILLFKSSNSGYQIVKEDIFEKRSLLFTKIKDSEESDIKDLLSIRDRIKNKNNVSLDELEKLDQLLLKFYKQKQQKFTRFSAGTIALLIIATSTTSLISTLIFSGVSNLKAATYGWVQTDWTGGADDLATANHSDNQTDWTKIFSKDAAVDTGTAGELSLSNSQVAITDTSDDDFNNTTRTNNSGGFYIADGTIQLKKQDGAICANDEECKYNYCKEGVCSGYISGPCTGIEVYPFDLSEKMKWKTETTLCVSPQCSGNFLVADNSVDFSDYPARDGCKSVDGRLPSLTELTCLYNNQASYGDNFQLNFYYSNQQYDSTSVYVRSLANGSQASSWRTADYYVRCVRDL